MSFKHSSLIILLVVGHENEYDVKQFQYFAARS